MTGRTMDSVRNHYVIERKLADRLRAAPAEQRSTVYGEVYDELFSSVPDHPQLSVDPRERERHVREKFRFASRFLTNDSCLMEIGAGDCLFSISAAPHIRRGVVVDVSKVIVSAAETVANLDIVITDGVSLPVEPGSVDVAYSDQLTEHLHLDDAVAQLKNVARAVRPGGVYICITPNRVSGPHDVSRGFDEVATGFHMHEYTGREIRPLFLEAGFRRVDFYAGGRGRYLRIPTTLALLTESIFEHVPKAIRARIPALPQYLLFGLNVVATR
jgi:SAM-dependent methyltransferase